MHSFYELEDDLERRGRWHLGYLMEHANHRFDDREFRYGIRIDSGSPLRCKLWNEEKVVAVTPPLTLYRSYEGVPLDFTYTDSCMPIATKRVAEILAAIAGDDIQRFPIQVDQLDEKYEIINVISVVDCLDVQRSDTTWFEEGNDIRPDLAGKPWSVFPLFVDSDRVSNRNIFRIRDYTEPVIVSEAIMQAFEQAEVSGVRFNLVS